MPACSPRPYVGRFAPSPSGPLHFGSLVCALASYLDARQHAGKWLVRIEDIDPPREQPGASQQILNTLEAHGLIPDEPVWYQSQRSQAYRDTLNRLARQGLSYRCSCTRKRVIALNNVYDGHCRKSTPPPDKPCAIRFYIKDEGHVAYEDRVQGTTEENVLTNGGDFIIHRKDGLFAYQLAVVVDDIAQGITQVVRGLDLADSTGKQILLFKALGGEAPQFAHIPLVVDNQGQKLSKQAHAAPVQDRHAKANLITALRFMNIPTPPALKTASVAELLAHAREHFHLTGFSTGTLPAPS